MEQVTSDALSTTEDNELICEKLLGWTQSSILGFWFPSPCHVGTLKTPSFATWAEAGLILEALPKELEYVVGYCDIEKQWYCGQAVGADTYADAGPLAIRAAALAYVKGEHDHEPMDDATRYALGAM